MNNVVYQLQDRWLQSQQREATSRRVADALEELARAIARLDHSRTPVPPQRTLILGVAAPRMRRR